MRRKLFLVLALFLLRMNFLYNNVRIKLLACLDCLGTFFILS